MSTRILVADALYHHRQLAPSSRLAVVRGALSDRAAETPAGVTKNVLPPLPAHRPLETRLALLTVPNERLKQRWLSSGDRDGFG